MIAMKREVAAEADVSSVWQVFPRSECQVRKLATSHCTVKESVLREQRAMFEDRTHPVMCTVTTCRTELVRYRRRLFLWQHRLCVSL